MRHIRHTRSFEFFLHPTLIMRYAGTQQGLQSLDSSRKGQEVHIQSVSTSIALACKLLLAGSVSDKDTLRVLWQGVCLLR